MCGGGMRLNEFWINKLWIDPGVGKYSTYLKVE